MVVKGIDVIAGNFFTNGISKLPASNELFARSPLFATPSWHPELTLGPHPKPHSLLGGSELQNESQVGGDG